MELADYVAVLRRRWRWLVTSVLLGVLAGSTYVALTPKTYESETSLFINAPGAEAISVTSGNLVSQDRVKSYADLVDGRDLADLVITQLGLHISARDLVGDVSGVAVEATNILEIDVRASSPQLAQQIAQGYARVLPGYIVDIEKPNGDRTSPIRATVVDAASLDKTAVAPSPARDIGLAVVLLLLLGTVAAFARDRLDRSVRDRRTATTTLGAPLLGSIERWRGRRHPPVYDRLEPNDSRAESMRVLRANIVASGGQRANKVFVVTSSTSGEGATTTAIDLAVSLAAADVKTLLIDGDLRHPAIAERLGLDGQAGLTSLLTGEAQLSDALQSYEPCGLTVLASGPASAQPAELLQSDAIRSLMTRLREEFEVIVVDAPAVLPVADAGLLAAQATGVVVVVRKGAPTIDQLDESRQRLHTMAASVAGVVVVGVRRHRRTAAYV